MDDAVVYVMYLHNRMTGQSQLMGVFDKPKTARKFYDNRFDVKTKGLWKKCEGGARRYEFAYFQTFIERYELIKG